ncbi:unnamed protein product [Caenorhabditis brenneri]
MDSNSLNPSSSVHQNDYEPKAKQPRIMDNYIARAPHQMRLPIILPKLPSKPSSSQGTPVRLITSPPSITPSSSNPRPLISLLDRTQFRDRSRIIINQPVVKPKKCYYTELNEIRREFGIPETFDTTKPNTMSGVALADKLQLLQRLRGENKFLQEAIQTKQKSCEDNTILLEQTRRTTNETYDHCQMLRESLQDLETESSELRDQLR